MWLTDITMWIGVAFAALVIVAVVTVLGAVLGQFALSPLVMP
jgi:hypothetical protein